MALIHDDLIDGATLRRGVPSVHLHAAGRARPDGRVSPDTVGRSVALLAGDLAAVLADDLLARSGFEPDALARAREVYDAMRVQMAAGQAAELLGEGAVDVDEAARRASLRGGAYSIEGPLRIGARLAAADDATEAALGSFGSALGRAFQLADDLRDGEAATGVDGSLVGALVDAAIAALGPLPADVATELTTVAAEVRAVATAVHDDDATTVHDDEGIAGASRQLGSRPA
jgi:geranylgeranyl pyrophosphate synthase